MDDGNLRYYHGDHLGSSNVITNDSGEQVALYEYSPFGEVSYQSGTYTTNIKYTGKIQDDNGLYYYGARYYDPVIGRFITPDTIVQAPQDPQSLNRYAYCRNNPIKYVDPTGHSWKKFWQKYGGYFGLLGSFVNATITGDWNQFGRQAAMMAATMFAAAFVAWAIGPMIAGLGNSMAASGAGTTFFEGFVLGGLEVGLPTFAGSLAGGLASGQKFTDALRGAAISGGIAFVGAGLIEGSYAAGWQDKMHFSDTRMNEVNVYKGKIASGDLQGAIDYKNALRGRYGMDSLPKADAMLRKYGFNEAGGKYSRYFDSKTSFDAFGGKVSIPGNTNVSVDPLWDNYYLGNSTKYISISTAEGALSVNSATLWFDGTYASVQSLSFKAFPGTSSLINGVLNDKIYGKAMKVE